MSQTDVIDTVEMEETEKEEKSCDLCKLSYSSNEGLEEHYWSLMHHIKIEQKKKGTSHNCTLCFAICQNIIEYGKHLNGDKHKRALEESRRQKEGDENISSGKKALLDKLSDMEKANFDDYHSDDNLEDKQRMEAESNISDPEVNQYRHFPGKRGHFKKHFRGHQRSFSQPDTKFKYRKGHFQPKQFRNYENRTFNAGGQKEHESRMTWYDDTINFDNPHWHQDGFNFDYQMPWQQGWNNEQFAWQQDGYQDYSSNQQPVWGGPAVEDFRASYPGFERKGHYQHIENFGDSSNGRHDDSDVRHKNSNRDDHRKDRHSSRRRENDYYNNSVRHARSLDRDNRHYDDGETFFPSDLSRDRRSPHSKLDDPGNLKRRRNDYDRNENKSRRECDSPSDDLLKKSIQTSDKDRNQQEVTSSDKSALPSKRYRQQPVVEKRLDEADSTTDIDGVDKVTSKSNISRNKSLYSDSSTSGKKKSKQKKKKSGTKSPTESPKTVKKTKEKTEESLNILEKAEKLCKDLRDKREKAKMENDKKEKQKKIDKTKELNLQLKNLSNINKSYVKGVLSDEVEKLSPGVSDQVKMNPTPSSVLKSKRVSFEPVSSAKSDEQQFVIDRIRQEIEESVSCSPKGKSQGKDKGQDILMQNPNLSNSTQDNQGDDSLQVPQGNSSGQGQNSEPLTKDSLLKMINSPRSRKERLYIADMLRSYAKSQNKLSLPRFNLQLSGLYDDMEDTAQDLHLEELPPDVQLQIAHMIEADIKPDITELERALFVDKQFQSEISQLEECPFVMPKTEFTSPDRHLLSVTDTNNIDLDSLTMSNFTPSVRGHSSKVGPEEPQPEVASKSGRSQTEKDLNVEVPGNSSHTVEISKRNNVETISIKSEPALSLHDLSYESTSIKQEPADTEYENTCTAIKNSNISLDSDKASSDRQDLNSHLLNLSSIHNESKNRSHDPDSQQNAPAPEVLSARSDFSGMDVLSGSNSEVEKVGSCQTANVSLHSSMSSLQSENLFETVYDISLKEENLRQDISLVDSRISDLNKVIEEATYQLQRCKEKKQLLMKEEESLRTHRLKILKDAKDIQQSARNLSQGSISNVFNSRHNSLSSSNLSDGTLTNVSSLSSSTSGLVRRLEPERDHHSQSFAKSLPPSGNLKQRRHSLSESGHNLSETQANSYKSVNDTSSSLSRLDNQPEKLYSQMVEQKSENRHSVQLSAVNLNENNVRRQEQDSKEVTSPVGLKNRQLDRSVYLQLPPPLEPVKISNSVPSKSLKTSELDTREKTFSRTVDLQNKKSDTLFAPFSPPQSSSQYQPPSSVPRRISQETCDVDRSTELKKAGFVTLNSLLKPGESENDGSLTKMLSSEASSLEEFLSGFSDSDSTRKDSKRGKEKRVRRSKRLNPEPVKEKDDENKKFGNVNVKYMGTLPNDIDRDSFLKQIGGGKQPDKLSYMLVESDQSQDVLLKLQSIIGGNSGIRDGKHESLTSLTTQSSVGDTRLMELDYKSESSSGKPELVPVHHETDSNYESIASNCSLGEKIKRYCKSNKSTVSRKRKEVSIEDVDTDSDPDKTIQDEEATPVRALTECSVVLQKLEHKGEIYVPVVEDSPLLDRFLPDQNVSRSLSPSRKRLKTKKERDRKSVRKQKEEYIVDSSSDANSEDDDDDDLPKLTDLKQKLKFRGSDSPVKEIDPVDHCLVETGSEDMIESEVRNRTTCISLEHSKELDRRKSLLDEVQLESVTESEDNRPGVDDTNTKAERFKLKPDVLATFRAAMKNTIKQGRDFIKNDPINEEPVGMTIDGPESPVLDIQTLDHNLYVCYRCMVIRQFHLKTGELLKEYLTQPASMNCLHVTVVNSSVRLYAGGHSCVLMLFDSKKGIKLSSEKHEEGIQCMHGNYGKLYIGTIQGSVIVKNIKTGKILDTFKYSEKPVSCIESATEGTRKLLLVASHDSVIYVCDSSSGLLLRMLEGHKKSPFCLHVDGHNVYSGSIDKAVLEHHLLTGDLIWTYNQPEGIVSSICEYKDYILCSSYDKFIYCFEKKNRKLIKKFYGAGKSVINKMAVSDGQIITGGREGQLEVIPLSQGDGFCCRCKGCDEVYGLKDHLLHHLLVVHVPQNTPLSRCQWKGCNDWITAENDNQEAKVHMKSHLS